VPVRRRLRRALVGAIVAAAAAAPVARADSPSADRDRFFIDKIDDDSTADATLWQGSLTSTTFFHRENAAIAAPLSTGGAGTENAAPFLRLFTDLRAQLDARHVSGGPWDGRIDARLRYVPQVKETWKSFAPQSGTFSGNEYDLRELYAVHGGDRTDVTVGRQIVLDLAATKIDGIRFDYAKNEKWTYLGFAGLYPVRGSRSVTTDYPKGVDAAGAPTQRVLPGAVGGGAAYRTPRSYGAIGVVGIASLAKDNATGTDEKPRVFVTANGYYRPSVRLDLFHYAVVDVVGAGGAALTNLSLGANWKPEARMRIEAQVNTVDTETLNVQAQTQLEDPGPLPGVVQNNITVSRIASQSARLGLSVGIGKTERFEVSTAVQLRRRPDIALTTGDGTAVTIKAAQGAEVMVQAVDRHSVAGLRLSGMLLRSFGVGSTNISRSEAWIGRLGGQRDFKNGKGQWQVDLGYVSSKDDDAGIACDSTMLATCWGSSRSRTISATGLTYYRLGGSWLGVASLEVAEQALTVSDAAMTVKQPGVIMFTGLVRLAYRF
jgi:hypothetical protein